MSKSCPRPPYNPEMPSRTTLCLLFPALFLPACNTPAPTPATSPSPPPAPPPLPTPTDPNHGMLDVETEPPGALVTVDGEKKGLTPITVKGLSVEHPVTVEIAWPHVKPSKQV